MNLKEYLAYVNIRCKNNGMNPDDPFIVNHFVTSEELKETQEQHGLFLDIANGILDKVMDFMKDDPVLMAITDDQPVILQVMGNPRFVNGAKEVGIQPGAIFQEKFIGTNAPSAALELKIPVSLIGTDHFYTLLDEFACYSIPIRHKKDIIATVSLLTTLRSASEFMLQMSSTAGFAIERELVYRNNDVMEIT